MTINIQKRLQKITISNPNWKTLYRKLRINNKIIDSENFSAPALYRYQNANLIQRFDETIYWTSITVVGKEAKLELQSRARFDSDGNFLDGIMNTFSFGMMDMDEEVIKEYFEETNGKFSSDKYWDVISDKNSDSI